MVLAVIAVVALAVYLMTAQGTFAKDLGGISVISSVEIAGYANSAGFNGDDLITAVAVALAESSGNTVAYNPETKAGAPEGKGSYGLWQIYLHAHPEFEGQNLFDPQTNANAAYSVYQGAGNSFTPWSTFKSGAYEAHVQVASDSVNA